jgi:pyruvate ferredoxin oxidoreductase alpha subunit
MGDFAPPIIYAETKWAQEVHLRDCKEVVLECWKEFGKVFKRNYSPLESYHAEGAKTLLFTMGSFSETAMVAVDKLREEGKDIGLIRLRLWRPFPFEEFRHAVKDAEALIVLDRAISFGGPGGAVCSELKAALYGETKKPKIVSFVGGLGGRDITVEGFESIINKGMEIAKKGSKHEFEIFGVRE